MTTATSRTAALARNVAHLDYEAQSGAFADLADSLECDLQECVELLEESVGGLRDMDVSLDGEFSSGLLWEETCERIDALLARLKERKP